MSNKDDAIILNDAAEVLRKRGYVWHADACENIAEDISPDHAEPQGLGAVVRDEDGDLWTRIDSFQWLCSDEGVQLEWSSLKATFGVAEVLSQGYVE